MTGGSVVTKSSSAVSTQRIERRAPVPPDQLPMEMLRQIPGLVILERLPVPTLALDHAGTILFLNGAFCDMVGYSCDELLPNHLEGIFHRIPADDRWEALVEADTPRLVELRHKCGHPVWASMSKPAFRSRCDAAALVTLHDRTEELWLVRGVAESACAALIGNTATSGRRGLRARSARHDAGRSTS